jgi:DNA polymerase III delta subunit
MAKRTAPNRASDRKVTISTLESRLKEGPPSVSVIVGKEDLLRREAIEMILAAIPGGVPDPDSMLRYQGTRNATDDQIRQVFDELRTPSLFGTGPVVIIHDAQNWLKSDPDSWVQFLSQPPAGSFLILTTDALDGRSKVSKALASNGLWIAVNRPFHRPPPWQPDARPWDHEMNSWVVSRFRKKKLKASPPVSQLLIDRIGPQMDQLAAAIEKISTICDSRNISDVDDDLIVANTSSGGDGSSFELVDSWFEQNRANGLKVLKDILERGALDEKDQRNRDPQRLLLQFMALSLKRARELRAVHSIVARGGGEKQILEEAGIARPFLPRIRKQYKSCDVQRTQRIIETLIEMDWQLKTGAGPRPEEMIERALVKI